MAQYGRGGNESLINALARQNPQVIPQMQPRSRFLEQFLANQTKQNIQSIPELALKLGAVGIAQYGDNQRQDANRKLLEEALAEKKAKEDAAYGAFAGQIGTPNPQATAYDDLAPAGPDGVPFEDGQGMGTPTRTPEQEQLVRLITSGIPALRKAGLTQALAIRQAGAEAKADAAASNLAHQRAIELKGSPGPATTPKDTRTPVQKNAKVLHPNDPEKQRKYIERVTTMSKAPVVNINSGGRYGKPPSGMAWAFDKSGNVKTDPQGAPIALKIKGALPAIKSVEKTEKAYLRQKAKARAGNTVIQDIGRALNIVKNNRTASGPPAWVMKNVVGTDAFVANGHIQSALSNVGLDTLQAMREASPTGGALGQVPIQQQKRLEQVLGSLDVGQPKEVLTDNLRRVHNIYMDIVYGTQEEIEALIEEGTISAIDAKPIHKRFELSFDEFGAPRGEDADGEVINNLLNTYAPKI
jgi:hypothetical protein